jgi:hypothetical protein
LATPGAISIITYLQNQRGAAAVHLLAAARQSQFYALAGRRDNVSHGAVTLADQLLFRRRVHVVHLNLQPVRETGRRNAKVSYIVMDRTKRDPAKLKK